MSDLRNIPLDEAVAEARVTFAAARPKARACHDHAAQHMPGGNTRTVLFHGPFPIRAERGEGAYLHDTDGHRYLNLLGEYTAGLFGHSHPRIRQALHDAIDIGVNLGAHNLAEAKLAELVSERFPVMERLRFTNSGTEANLMAVATARYVTGRNKVMVMDGGYHGGLLYFRGGAPNVNAPFDYVMARYNDAEYARKLIAEHGDDLACVLVEPMIGSGGCIPADDSFLAALREATAKAGAKLIFDEVMTSRFGTHGGGALAGVQPDMMTLGKWVGGGMSFGAYGGTADIMEIYDPTKPNAVPHAGTFNNNVLSMTAGCVALDEIFTADEAERLHARGDALRRDVNAIFAEAGVAMCATGKGSLMTIHGMSGQIRQPTDLAPSNDQAKELLFFDLLERGYYVARRGFIALSLVVTDEELNGFRDALRETVAARHTVLPHTIAQAA